MSVDQGDCAQTAACMDMTKWKQSCTDWRRCFLSSISMANSLSIASWISTQVLISCLSFSLFQCVLNVIGTPSQRCGSIWRRRSQQTLINVGDDFGWLAKAISADLDDTLGHDVRLLIQVDVVLIWVVESAHGANRANLLHANVLWHALEKWLHHHF